MVVWCCWGAAARACVLVGVGACDKISDLVFCLPLNTNLKRRRDKIYRFDRRGFYQSSSSAENDVLSRNEGVKKKKRRKRNRNLYRGFALREK